MQNVPKTLGDYTGLAEDYSKYRPDYAPSILTALLALTGKPASQIDAVDVGAGTGIWTRMLAARGLHSVTAIEPNADMRRCGERDSPAIAWRDGSGEKTGLADGCADLVSMASSFHWVDTDKGLCEFHRLLRPGGRFVALWNPRLIAVSPLLVEVEAELTRLSPEYARVSSGRSGIADRMTEILNASPLYRDTVYLEGRHVIRQSPAVYLGVWRSVNEVQVRLGPERFAAFLAYIAKKIEGLAYIETTYQTRAWSAARA
ncbi:MAG: class I SAM-dependent methyltransferase [Rhizomicrobium sp.]|nr:class I SAM-dependent methyltransferase [Rhizomicrobium sp.]